MQRGGRRVPATHARAVRALVCQPHGLARGDANLRLRAHHWARWLAGLGIQVTLLPARYVRAYVKRNKTDAAALLEASRCSDLRPVRVKSVEQQALQALHRTRSLWQADRARRINTLRGFCREFGIAIAQGARLGIEQIARVLAEPRSAIPELLRPTMVLLVEEVRLFEARIGALEREAAALVRHSPGVHDAADHSGDRPAHQHGDGGGHLGRRDALQGCAALRELVRPDAARAFVVRRVVAQARIGHACEKRAAGLVVVGAILHGQRAGR
jgi:transposase